MQCDLLCIIKLLNSHLDFHTKNIKLQYIVLMTIQGPYATWKTGHLKIRAKQSLENKNH